MTIRSGGIRRKAKKIPQEKLLLAALVAGVSLAVPYLYQHAVHRETIASQAGFVERVIDGDTAVLTGGERVRYIGIDTPELHHPKKPVEYYAREAKEFNRQLVEGKKVRLEFDVDRRDKYKRLLAYVFLEDGTFVNAELLRQGYAQLLTVPPNVKYTDLFVQCQKEAREANRGLWGKR
ncbi:MAG: thermonuclease family protein [Candidatus Omnitrophica bacterium]|nr:thermonuclease family protein [Candidatus Omnitrophota bacterium]